MPGTGFYKTQSRCFVCRVPINTLLTEGTGTVYVKKTFSSSELPFSHSIMSDSAIPWTIACQVPPSFTVSGVCLNSCASTRWGHPTSSSSVVPFSSCLQSFPASGSFPMSWLFASGGQSIVASTQNQSFQWIFRVDFLEGWLIGSPCSPRDSQESFPAPQFESIKSSVLSLLYGPTLTSVHDYWKNHSFDYTDL